MHPCQVFIYYNFGLTVYIVITDHKILNDNVDE